MNAVSTPDGAKARRGAKIINVFGPLSPARRTALHQVPFEGERARGPVARGRGPVGGSGKEPA
jgi:hypothetical protein